MFIDIIRIDLFDQKADLIMDLIDNWSSKFSDASHLAPYMACKYGHMIPVNHIWVRSLESLTQQHFWIFSIGGQYFGSGDQSFWDKA